jgi:NAD(P)H-dependent flavin oxidoreductase YrpB (nitropropane dioxygenase family)
MYTDICERAGIRYPIFAFSHCRDVVAAVSLAGGMGVLGTTRYSPEQLERELAWLDRKLDGKPYGVDLIFAGEGPAAAERADLPEAHRRFVTSLIERFGIPPSAGNTQEQFGVGSNLVMSARHAREIWEVVQRHPVRLLASALGPAPAEMVAVAKARGVLIAGLVGRVAHVRRHVAGGSDLIVATGTEAGGHCGEIGTLALVPQIVRAAGDLPVLAAGGIATGEQIAACLALGAQGVWTGSLWLTTVESDVDPVVKKKLLAAGSEDTIRSTAMTGKPSRQLANAWVRAWHEPGAPAPLPSPWQGMLNEGALVGAYERRMEHLMGTPVGQGVGLVRHEESVRDVFRRLLEEYGTAAERSQALYARALERE